MIRRQQFSGREMKDVLGSNILSHTHTHSLSHFILFACYLYSVCAVLFYCKEKLRKVFFPLWFISTKVYTWLYTLRITNLWCTMFSKFVLY